MKRTSMALAVLGLLAGPALADPLEGLAPVDLTDYMPREGASAVLLLQDLIEGHPETLEGQPAMTISLQPTQDGKALLIDVEKTGYLDDAVAGEKYRAIVVPGTAQAWRLARMGSKTKCARGDGAGEWQTGLCP